MNNKKVFVSGLIALAIVLGAQQIIFRNKIENPDVQKTAEELSSGQPVPEPQAVEVTNQNDGGQASGKAKQITVAKDVIVSKDKNPSLNQTIVESGLPISVISELSTLPENIQNTVLDISKSSDGVYMMKHKGNKVLLIVENQANLRHGVEFIEISVPNGHRTTTTFGYNDKMQDSNNDIWEYDKVADIQRPTRHTKYDSDGDMEFVEVWNYDDNPVKYEMKDKNGKTVSIRKETLDDGTNLRIEHLLYDHNGKTKVNITAAYEGGDIKRFTYYNADKPDESGSVFGEYKDGVKIKETVYTSDFKVKNVFEPIYQDGSTKEIKVLDNKNNEIRTVLEK